MTKKYYNSKTMWVNMAVALFTTLSMMSDVIRPITKEYADVIILTIAIVNGVLRTVTTQGIER